MALNRLKAKDSHDRTRGRNRFHEADPAFCGMKAGKYNSRVISLDFCLPCAMQLGEADEIRDVFGNEASILK